MSLILEREGTNPPVSIKAWGILMGSPETISLGDYEISIEDFLIATHYVLTNCDTYPGDPREQFIKSVKAMELVEGYNRGSRRFKTTVHPVNGFIPPFGA